METLKNKDIALANEITSVMDNGFATGKIMDAVIPGYGRFADLKREQVMEIEEIYMRAAKASFAEGARLRKLVGV